MAPRIKMPHPEHEEHLCFLENIGYLRSPELLEIGVDRKEEYEELVRKPKFFAGNAAGLPAHGKSLCEPEKL